MCTYMDVQQCCGNLHYSYSIVNCRQYYALPEQQPVGFIGHLTSLVRDNDMFCGCTHI